jgi:hypothetical protein
MIGKLPGCGSIIIKSVAVCSSGVGGGWESARKNNSTSCRGGQWDPTHKFIFLQGFHRSFIFFLNACYSFAHLYCSFYIYVQNVVKKLILFNL